MPAGAAAAAAARALAARPAQLFLALVSAAGWGGPGRTGAGGLEAGLVPPLLLLAGMRKQEAVDS